MHIESNELMIIFSAFYSTEKILSFCYRMIDLSIYGNVGKMCTVHNCSFRKVIDIYSCRYLHSVEFLPAK